MLISASKDTTLKVSPQSVEKCVLSRVMIDLGYEDLQDQNGPPRPHR